ncbi:MAG: carbohydrate kinase family protein [Candidatus Bathyarchaeia archaeon]
MSTLKFRKELENFASQTPKRFKVTVLPDFFIDRLIDFDWNTTEFSRLVGDVAKRKGGSIDGVLQTEMRGGNSINVASALAKLGAEVTPIICTSEWGLEQLKFFLRETGVDLSHVKVLGKASITTALEFKDKEAKTNVMIRDLGALADFGPEDLDENDYATINDADYTCLFNWAGTRKNGTRLAQAIFGRAKKLGKGKTYFDTADPTPNIAAASSLVEKILKSDLIDILSVNENEAIVYARLLDNAFDSEKKHLGFAELAMEAARILARNLHARIDLHTSAFSATLRGKREVVSPTFRIKVLRATGAGDAWTAGNIVGDYNGLSDESRLTLANAVSACYLSDPEGKHPTWQRLGAFLKDSR